jgi:acetyl-CoA C-acetyltransferase
MSRVPMGSNGGAWATDPSIAMKSYFTPQGVGADAIATKYGFSRTDLDSYAVQSQQRAAQAWKEEPLQEIDRAGERPTRRHASGSRRIHAPETTLQSLGALEPSFEDARRDDAWLRRRHSAALSGNRKDRPRPPRRQLVRHR